MPQAKVREGKRYRYWRKSGVEIKRDRYRNKTKREVGDFVYAEAGEVIEVTANSLKGAADFLEPVGVVSIGKQDEPYSDTESILDGLWRAVRKSVSKVDDPELLAALREAEVDGRARGSVLDAIDDAMDECCLIDDAEDGDEGDTQDGDGDGDGDGQEGENDDE